jgi:hypothetical protein
MPLSWSHALYQSSVMVWLVLALMDMVQLFDFLNEVIFVGVVWGRVKDFLAELSFDVEKCLQCQ